MGLVQTIPRIYQTAYADIKGNLASCTKNTCAVIMDLDETVLSNSEYETILRNNGFMHSSDLMDRWWKGVIKTSMPPLVPGAKEFIDNIKNKVSVVYITARDKTRRTITKNIVEKAELFSGDTNLYFTDGKSKQAARDTVKPLYNNVLAYFGDQIGDIEFEVINEKKVCLNCYILPNPIHGDWVNK